MFLLCSSSILTSSRSCGELSHSPGVSGTLGDGSLLCQRRDPFPGSPGRVCCHCLLFVVAISRGSVPALHAGLLCFRDVLTCTIPCCYTETRLGCGVGFPFPSSFSLLSLPPSFPFAFPFPLSSFSLPIAGCAGSAPEPLSHLPAPSFLGCDAQKSPAGATPGAREGFWSAVSALEFIPQPQPGMFSALREE